MVHHDDLLYIFRVSFFPNFDNNSPEMKTVERMTAIWSNFAKTGEPITKDDSQLFTNVTWEKFTHDNQRYLNIGKELVMETRLYSDRMDFWDKLYNVDYKKQCYTR